MYLYSDLNIVIVHVQLLIQSSLSCRPLYSYPNATIRPIVNNCVKYGFTVRPFTQRSNHKRFGPRFQAFEHCHIELSRVPALNDRLWPQPTAQCTIGGLTALARHTPKTELHDLRLQPYVQAGASLEAQDEQGMTPLDLASDARARQALLADTRNAQAEAAQKRDGKAEL